MYLIGAQCALGQTALPYQQNFDGAPFTPGSSIHGTQGWIVEKEMNGNGTFVPDGSLAVISQDYAQSGARSVKLVPAAENHRARISLQTGQPITTVVYTDFWFKPAAAVVSGNPPLVGGSLDVDGAGIAFHRSASNPGFCSVSIVDGDGLPQGQSQGGELVDIGVQFEVDDQTGLATDWHRFTIRHDYAAGTWDLWIDHQFVAAEAGFGPAPADPGEWLFWGDSTSPAYLDTLSVSVTPPVFPTTPNDTDGDGLAEVDEGRFGTGTGDPDSDNDGDPDGLEVRRGTDPLDPADKGNSSGSPATWARHVDLMQDLAFGLKAQNASTLTLRVYELLANRTRWKLRYALQSTGSQVTNTGNPDQLTAEGLAFRCRAGADYVVRLEGTGLNYEFDTRTKYVPLAGQPVNRDGATNVEVQDPFGMFRGSFAALDNWGNNPVRPSEEPAAVEALTGRQYVLVRGVPGVEIFYGAGAYRQTPSGNGYHLRESVNGVYPVRAVRNRSDRFVICEGEPLVPGQTPGTAPSGKSREGKWQFTRTPSENGRVQDFNFQRAPAPAGGGATGEGGGPSWSMPPRSGGGLGGDLPKLGGVDKDGNPIDGEKKPGQEQAATRQGTDSCQIPDEESKVKESAAGGEGAPSEPAATVPGGTGVGGGAGGGCCGGGGGGWNEAAGWGGDSMSSTGTNGFSGPGITLGSSSPQSSPAGVSMPVDSAGGMPALAADSNALRFQLPAGTSAVQREAAAVASVSGNGAFFSVTNLPNSTGFALASGGDKAVFLNPGGNRRKLSVSFQKEFGGVAAPVSESDFESPRAVTELSGGVWVTRSTLTYTHRYFGMPNPITGIPSVTGVTRRVTTTTLPAVGFDEAQRTFSNGLPGNGVMACGAFSTRTVIVSDSAANGSNEALLAAPENATLAMESVYARYSFGERLLSSRSAPSGTSGKVTAFQKEWYDDTAPAAVRGLLKMNREYFTMNPLNQSAQWNSHPSDWTRYRYFTQGTMIGQLDRSVRMFREGTPPASEPAENSGHIVFTRTAETNPGQPGSSWNETVKIKGTTVDYRVFTRIQSVFQSHLAETSLPGIREARTHPGGTATTETYWYPATASGNRNGRIAYIKYPDGTAESFAVSAEDEGEITRRGRFSTAGEFLEGEETERTTGNTLFVRRGTVGIGLITTAQRSWSSMPSSGLPSGAYSRTNDLTGEKSVSYYAGQNDSPYAVGQLMRIRSEDGSSLRYEYDALGRVWKVTSGRGTFVGGVTHAAQTTVAYIYDEDGRRALTVIPDPAKGDPVWANRNAYLADPKFVVEFLTYHEDGRLASRAVPAPSGPALPQTTALATTHYDESWQSIAGSFRRVSTIRLPRPTPTSDRLVEERRYFPDGTLESVYRGRETPAGVLTLTSTPVESYLTETVGSTVRERTTAYTGMTEPGRNQSEVTFVKSQYGAAISSGWLSGTTETLISAVSYYPNARVRWRTDPDGVRHIVTYNALGEPEYTGLDADQNGNLLISGLGLDRVSRNSRAQGELLNWSQAPLEPDSGTSLSTTTTALAEWGTPAWTTISRSEATPSGLWSRHTDASGRSTITRKVINTDPMNPDADVEVLLYHQDPSGQITLQRTVNGLLMEQRAFRSDEVWSADPADPLPPSLYTITYGYEADGRLTSSSHSRTGLTTYAYLDLSSTLVSVTLPGTVGGGAVSQYKYVYDQLGRLITLIQPDGSLTQTEYDILSGQVSRQYGSQTYDTTYQYDYRGRMVKMTTKPFPAPGIAAEPATTEWFYNAQGRLITKKYAAFDENGDGNIGEAARTVAWTYTAGGRLATRKWGRNAYTYYYYHPRTGDLAYVDYNSSTTRDLAYTYDRLGRVIRVSEGTCGGSASYYLLNVAGNGQVAGTLQYWLYGQYWDPMYLPQVPWSQVPPADMSGFVGLPTGYTLTSSVYSYYDMYTDAYYGGPVHDGYMNYYGCHQLQVSFAPGSIPWSGSAQIELVSDNFTETATDEVHEYTYTTASDGPGQPLRTRLTEERITNRIPGQPVSLQRQWADGFVQTPNGPVEGGNRRGLQDGYTVDIGLTPFMEVDYTWGANGQLAQLDALIPDTELPGVDEHWRANYSYATPGDGTMIESLTRSRVTGTSAEARVRSDYVWHPHRDSLQSITNKVVAQVDNGEESWLGYLPQPGNGVPDFTVSQHTYTLNSLGQRSVHQQDYNLFVLEWTDARSATRQYHYNSRGEVGAASTVSQMNIPNPQSENEQFVFDGIGNRKWHSRGQTAPASAPADNLAAPAGASTYTSGPANTYRTVTAQDAGGAAGSPPSALLKYDGDANLIDDGVFTYVWDMENRLIEVKPKVAQNRDRWLTFKYDWLSRRRETLQKCWGNGAWGGDFYQPTITRKFVYDGWNPVISTQVRNNGIECAEAMVWGTDISGTPQGAGGVGGLLFSQTIDVNGGASGWLQQMTVLHTYDGNGNTSEIIGGSGTNWSLTWTSALPMRSRTLAQFRYDSFGRRVPGGSSELWGTDSPFVETPFTFSSKWEETTAQTRYWDNLPGGGWGIVENPRCRTLNYYGYRFYHAELGRWINRDPLGEPGGLNLLGMLGNNPIDDNDLLGNGPCEDKFKSKLRNIAKNILSARTSKKTHAKIIQDRIQDFLEDPNDLQNRAGGGKKSPKWPARFTRNGHAALIHKHKALLSRYEAEELAEKQKYRSVLAEYLACKAAQRGVGKCCKTVLKKFGVIFFFVYDCATEDAGAAVDNATWPISELWQEDLPMDPDSAAEIEEKLAAASAEHYARESEERKKQLEIDKLKSEGNWPGYLPPAVPGAPHAMVQDF